jgi:hypothetical protein
MSIGEVLQLTSHTSCLSSCTNGKFTCLAEYNRNLTEKKGIDSVNDEVGIRAFVWDILKMV